MVNSLPLFRLHCKKFHILFAGMGKLWKTCEKRSPYGYDAPGIPTVCAAENEKVPLGEGRVSGLSRGWGYLRSGTGHSGRLDVSGPVRGGRGYSHLLHTGDPVLIADGTESLQQAGPLRRRGNAGAHYRLFQRRDLPSAGFQVRGIRHRYGGEDVHRSRAGHHLWDAGIGDLRRDPDVIEMIGGEGSAYLNRIPLVWRCLGESVRRIRLS